MAYDGNLIVIGETTPSRGDRVFDNRKRPMGIVERVFGPVDTPYVSVRPRGGGRMTDIVGKGLYVGGEEYGKGKRGSRGDRVLS